MSTYQVTTTGGTYEVETAPEQGALESTMRGAANNFPLAPQAISAVEPGDYSENLQGWNQKAQEAKAEHPVAYGAGAVGGALAPALIPGVGEALEASPIAGNALLGAANAVSNTDLTKNPGETVKQAALGAGVGAGTAGLMGAILPKPETLENFATKEAVKSAGVSPAYLQRLDPEEKQALGQFIQQNGLVNTDKQTALKAAQDLENKIGNKIGELGESSEKMGLAVDPAEHYKAVSNLLDKSSEYSQLSNREAKTLARNYKAGANDILNLPDNPQWSDIQKLKSQYGKLAFGPNGQIKDDAAKDTYFALSDMLKGIASKAQDNPELADEYKQALHGYHQIQPVIKGLSKMVGNQEAGGSGGGMGIAGMIKKLPGMSNPAINLPVGTTLAAMGHPFMGLMATTPTMMNPAIRSTMASGAAKILPSARQAMTQELADYLESKFGK